MSKAWMVDFDGVLADLSGAFVRAVNERFQTNYTPGDETDWHFWNRQPKAISNFVWQDCYGDASWFLQNVEPYEGALEALADLATDPSVCDAVYIVTARKAFHYNRVVKWIAKQGIPILSQIPVHCAEGYDKVTFCASLDPRPNVIVEDGAHNLRKFNDPAVSLYLVDRPWNQHEILPRADRVAGLHEVVNLVAQEVVA